MSIEPLGSTVNFVFRGALRRVSAFAPSTTLLDWLRLEARAHGTKEGCNEGDCGACTLVLVRWQAGRLVYKAVNACIVLLGQVHGGEVLTIEDLAASGSLHPIQQAFVDHHASQCGFCTPGFIMSLFALYHESRRPISRQQILDGFAGNLCRCTGYRPIIEAAETVLRNEVQDRFAEPLSPRLQLLQQLAEGAELFAGTPEQFFAAPVEINGLADLLQKYPQALHLGGASDVGLWITKGLKEPRQIIWSGRVAGFDHITMRADGGLSIGGGARLAEVRAPLTDYAPGISEVLRRFASVQIRNSATLGGNIANGSPIGDMAPCLIAFGAELVLQRAQSQRRLPLEDFFIAFRKQDRVESEFIAAVDMPSRAKNRFFRAYKISKRPDEDISAVLGAFDFQIEAGRIKVARVVFGGMAATPRRACLCERALENISLDEPRQWDTAITALCSDFAPIDDLRASADYRQKIAGQLLLRALLEAAGHHPAELVIDFAEAHR